MKKQIEDDYREVLSNEAGRRIFGGIFYDARLNAIGYVKEPTEAAYRQGWHDMGQVIANQIRAVGPALVCECELAYQEFLERFKGNGRNDSGNE